ncbi:MAG: type IV toxin-antitoxin system AbiEi family antitoxin [Muribaculaceae bacterium]|nr:type IV toxin-antitoxin system AbiEi family antitoxin [Muribaculaceae bacterium]
MDILLGSKINRLLSYGVYGGLFFSEWLSKMGYSAQLVKRYKDNGWLEALANGVMFRRNEKLSALAAVHSFNTQTGKNVRIAAHSALELHGFSHYIPMGKSKLMISFDPLKPKEWIKSDKFDMSIVSFSTGIFTDPQTQLLKKDNLKLIVSTPEQAFLECLHLVPTHYNYMDLYYLMEQLTSLDPQGVQKALENTSSQRVKRMFLYMAEKASHYWFDMLNPDTLGITGSKLQLVENGTYISKYKITVPKELNDYE